MSGTDLDMLESPMGHHDDRTPHRGPVNLESQIKALYNAIWKEGKPFIRDLAAADFPRRALFLVDSNSSFHSPPSAFLDPRFQGVVVQATSPETSCWESWAKQIRASFCIMSVWTRAEMRALQRTMEALGRASWANPPPGSSTYTPLDIFDLLGPSPRVCIRMSKSVRSEGAETAFRRYFASNHVFLEFDALSRATDYPSLSNHFFELDDVDLFFHLYSAMPSNP
ncbi:hypothetical protein LXA43DRAFT_1065260 [Ganoderma leucocontextum]|nr:hypothetical protein LXA43DRAFT_1065260 [Ganoderma leucocontextum]